MEAAVAARRGGNVRFVALGQQHARIEHELREAFARLLESGAYTDGEVPNAEAWAAEELSLPMHPDLTPDEVERVADAVHEAVYIPNARSGENRC